MRTTLSSLIMQYIATHKPQTPQQSKFALIAAARAAHPTLTVNGAMMAYLLPLYPPPPDLLPYPETVLNVPPVSYFRFEETTGLDASDSRGGVAALLVDGPPDISLWTPRDGAVLDSRCISGAGAARRVVIQNPGDYSPAFSGSWTVEFWMRMAPLVAAHEIINLDAATAACLRIYQEGPHVNVAQLNTALQLAVLQIPNCVDGAWHYFAIEHDTSGPVLRGYLDGVFTGQVAAVAPPFSAIVAVTLMNNQFGNLDTLNGSLDEVAFYGNVLGPEAVAEHYAARWTA